MIAVAKVVNAVDVSIIRSAAGSPVAGVEVIADPEDDLARGRSRDGERMETLVAAVAVAPVLGLAVYGGGGAVRSRVLCGEQAVQRIVGERLVAIAVAIVVNAVDVAVVRAAARGAVAGMKVIADRKDGLAGRRSRHGERLETLVVAEAAGDGRRPAAAAQEARGTDQVRPTCACAVTRTILHQLRSHFLH